MTTTSTMRPAPFICAQRGSEETEFAVEKALTSPRPRVRFTVGFDARLLVPLHAVSPLWLPDWVRQTLSGLPHKAPACASVVKESA
ncbi:hypothetical protein ABZ958_37895 [Streptomyces sp. NPDC046237]|uniref:hypothetical protein n=1 Tax=Streptomyces sp. NPDC046237 TaxID=3154914 RepID=UPI00340E17FA